MENKIDVAKLLKDCPEGMELDCTMYNNVTFIAVENTGSYPIKLLAGSMKLNLTKSGCYSNTDDAKCVIFPKGKTTWEGFVPPCKFKHGDILANNDCIFIYTGFEDELNYDTYAIIDNCGLFSVNIPTKKYATRFATGSEKQKLFDAIKANGYYWNPEIKTLRRLIEPKFKVGDKIEKCMYRFTITEVKEDYYLTKCGNKIPIGNQDDFNLVSNDFDINTLNPFDKVLVRDHDDYIWRADFYSHYEQNQQYWFVCVGDAYKQCIPFTKETANLIGTTNDCPDKYKTWKDE